MEFMAKVFFVFYTMVILAGGITAVHSRSLVRSLVGLVATMFGVAGLYMLMAAPFVAFMQILIYVGGVSVLIFFSIMLTRAAPTGDEAMRRPRRKLINSVLAMLAPGIFLGTVVIFIYEPGIETPAEVGLAALGHGLLGPYVLAFELVSIVLFVAMAGAVMLAWRPWGKK